MDQVDSGVKKYLNTISAYDNEFKKWEGRVTKIIKRYRDDTRSAGGNETAKFNILWSNVQTLIPAVYAKLPKADVSRRFGDNDPVGRVASLLIERALDFEIEHYPDFRATMKYCVEDRFLGGRGTAWVRYEPHVREQDMPEDGVQITEDVEGEAAEGQTPQGYDAPAEENVEPTDVTAGAEEMPEEIAYECAPTDYVHWKDFGHSIARTWEEVTEVWRWVYMNEDAIIERFGKEKAKSIPMDSGPEPLSGYGNTKREANQARICELWCKTTGKVYWISKNLPDFIDVRDDPLGLEEFFPCGRPLFATMTSDTLTPVPDFILYQDQANELDILSDRIDGLVKSLRVRGVYDASQPALQRLMTEGDNNSLIPIDKWMGFSEKGGLKGSIDLLPLDTLANALLQCYRAREDIKAQIYEITGISDIIRGQTSASETATAQQIKGQYAGLRLRALQEEVALFATDLLRLKAQIICTKFQAQTILAYAAAAQMSDADKELIPDALQLLAEEPLRNFRIDVAADSLVQIDENQNKQDRLEFLSAFSGFLREAIPAAQGAPQIVPMLVDMMKFGVGAFKGARSIEGSLDRMLDEFKQQQAQPQQPKPDPEMMKLQAQQQGDQMRVQAEAQAAQIEGQMDAQIEQAKMQTDMQIEQMKAQAAMQIETLRQSHDAQMKANEIASKEQFERYKAELDAATKVMVAQINAKTALDQSSLADEQVGGAIGNEELQGMQQAQQQADALKPLVDMHNEAMGAIKSVMEQMARPKRIIRDAQGRLEGVQ